MKITSYEALGKLPNPFIFENGEKVRTIDDWERRRPEIYKLAVEMQFGVMPPEPEFLKIEPLSVPMRPNTENQWRIITGTKKNPVIFSLYVHLPEKSDKYPAVIDGDMCYAPMQDRAVTEEFAKNGIMLAKFNRCEIVPDDRDYGKRRDGQLYRTYPDCSFSAIGAWAWGYSRVLDALITLGLVDERYVAFTGLSRGGKTALLAGACDRRATIVNPEATCAGGSSCYRVHMRGINENGTEGRSETLKDIVNAFPDWFNPEMKKYEDDEAALPFDEHYLKALIAPRIFFDSQALSDMWAGPVGTYQTNIAAREVWKLYGRGENVLWYWRSGGHDHTMEDFRMLISIINHEKDGTPLDEKFMALPFDPPEKLYDWECPKQ